MDQNTKVAIVELSQKEIYLMGKTKTYGYNVLGLQAPKRVEEEAFEKGWASISQEAIPDILGEADHIFLGVRSNASAEENAGDSAEKAITSSSLWNNFPAVKNGNFHNYNVDAFYYSDVVALRYADR
ncbi:ABC-type Fe3+-hydroxamate transport system substrate-binding protein [Bacillus chungangensis]|uniref:ABC-type Fe3+-hydroxamate transport system substrate-binding protein n=2 Tax=Bacillus chungangensis TaxID=587633 RepID=A0ABT9WST8_9BACI|nr:ABC-type Fe3+-hydroxamate transport system substrate-binding protein [Bacillus chungangensis]